MILTRVAVIVLLLAAQLVFAQNNGFKTTADKIKGHAKILSSDEMEGRAVGTQGLQKAAKYIAGKLSEWNVKPLGINNTYLQPVPMHGTVAQKESQLTLYNENEETVLSAQQDYLLIKTGPQTFIPNPVEIVFAGFGISAPEYDYDDYRELDVSGKMVVYFDGEPYSKGDDDYFSGEAKTLYSRPESKIRTALARGALGSIIIPNPRSSASWSELQRDYITEEVTLPGRVSGHLALFLESKIAGLLFRDAAINLTRLLENVQKNDLPPFVLKTRISFRGSFKTRDFSSPNILGMVQGSDPQLADSYLLLSAHYDHLGVGVPVKGDSIYNGLMDNAIGCAVLLELARNFAGKDFKPRRSLIFAFWTGEEKGLLGSRYYAENPIRPLYKTIANVNIDGLAAIGTFQDVIAVGGNYSSLGETVREIAAERGLALAEIPQRLLSEEAFYRSDQAAMAKVGVPALLILEGFTYKNISYIEAQNRLIEWFDTIYHTPQDDFSQPVDWNSAKQYTAFLFALANRLANITEEPQWKQGAIYKNAWLRNRAENR